MYGCHLMELIYTSAMVCSDYSQEQTVLFSGGLSAPTIQFINFLFKLQQLKVRQNQNHPSIYFTFFIRDSRNQFEVFSFKKLHVELIAIKASNWFFYQ